MRFRFFLSAGMRVSARIVLVCAVLWLSACSDPMPSPPFCRLPTGVETLPDITPPLSKNQPSACVIRDGRFLLVVEHRLSGKYDLPAGLAIEGESAACTAHRETFEETGLNVEVVKYVGQSNTGLIFFQCSQQSGFSAPDFAPPPPVWQSHEIADVVWIDPYEVTDKQWRFPEQLVEVRAAFADH